MNGISVKRIFSIGIILFVALSCTKKDTDHSLTVEEYRKLGIPDPGRDWSIDDFTEANLILGRMKWDRPYQLPVRDSKKSGRLFERMVSPENLNFVQDSTKSYSERAERIIAFVSVCGHWADVYSNPVVKSYYHREQIDVQIFMLSVAENMLTLAEEIYQSDDPTAAPLKYGYKTIKRDYLDCLTKELQIQSRTSQFPREDLDKLADSVYVSVMRNKERMDSSAIRELKQSLRVVLDSTSSDHIRNKYTTLQKTL